VFTDGTTRLFTLLYTPEIHRERGRFQSGTWKGLKLNTRLATELTAVKFRYLPATSYLLYRSHASLIKRVTHKILETNKTNRSKIYLFFLYLRPNYIRLVLNPLNSEHTTHLYSEKTNHGSTIYF